MRIKELADASGLSPHALRYYEKEGLIAPRFLARGANNYREYSAEAVPRLQAIKAMQGAGFTLSEIKDFIALWDSGTLDPGTALGILRRKIGQIDERVAELLAAKETLLRVFIPHVESGEECPGQP